MKDYFYPWCDVVLDLVWKCLREDEGNSFDIEILQLRHDGRTVKHRVHGCKLHHPDIEFVDGPKYFTVTSWDGEKLKRHTERVYIDGASYALNGSSPTEHPRHKLARHDAEWRREELLDDADVWHFAF